MEDRHREDLPHLDGDTIREGEHLRGGSQIIGIVRVPDEIAGEIGQDLTRQGYTERLVPQPILLHRHEDSAKFGILHVPMELLQISIISS